VERFGSLANLIQGYRAATPTLKAPPPRSAHIRLVSALCSVGIVIGIVAVIAATS
jgi:hypothetical protein